MPDPQITIKITATTDNVAAAVDEAKSHIERAQKAAELAADALGIKVPAALQEILAKSALVGPALEAAFPVVGTIALLNVVQQIPERIHAVVDALTQLSAEEKQQSEEAIADAKKHLQVEEAQVRARYELLAANAKDEVQKQGIRVREAAALVQVNEKYRDELVKQKKHFDDLIHGARQFAANMDEAAEASNYDVEQGADVALVYGAISRNKAENIEKSKEYKDVLYEVQLAEAKVTSEEAKHLELANHLQTKRIVDLTGLARAKGTISATAKKQAEEQAHAEQAAALALAGYWRFTGEEARKAMEEGQHISAIYSEGDLAHTRALQQQARDRLDFELATGRISQAEHDRLLKQEINAEYLAAKRILQARLARYRTDSQEYARTEVELRKLEDKHNAEMERADRQSLEKRQKQYQHYFQQISGVFNTAVNSWVQGTQTASQAFARMFDQIIMGAATMVEQFLQKKLEMWLMDKLLMKQNAESSIATSAGKTYSAAFADMASLGPAGLAAAPAIASGMAALAEAGGTALAEASAAGGQWEVPGIQSTILHPREMVLPASIAGRMRAMVESGGGMGGNLHFSFSPVVHALDAEGVDRVLNRHQRLFEARVDKYLRKKRLIVK